MPGVYYEGQLLGNETRNKEFKKGGPGYLKKILKEDVAKYVCGFLNSREAGTLYIGVSDDGVYSYNFFVNDNKVI